jgi:hypothetical protein
LITGFPRDEKSAATRAKDKHPICFEVQFLFGIEKNVFFNRNKLHFIFRICCRLKKIFQARLRWNFCRNGRPGTVEKFVWRLKKLRQNFSRIMHITLYKAGKNPIPPRDVWVWKFFTGNNN